MVETKTGDVLYRGFLSDFWLDKDGGLSQLHFENVRRRVFKDDASQNENYDDSTEEVDSRYYYIPGELFIIKYADVKNMNITYYEETLGAA